MKENQEQFYVVPGSVLEKILDGQSKILDLLNGKSSNKGMSPLGDYIPESEAKILLSKKTTWFWKMRTTGYLNASKFGGKNYYSKQEIRKLLDAAFTGSQK